MDDFHMLKTVSMDATHVVCAYPTGSAAVRCCNGAEPVPDTTYGCQNRKILGSCCIKRRLKNMGCDENVGVFLFDMNICLRTSLLFED